MVKKYGYAYICVCIRKKNMFQIARRHLVWFTGLTCDELSAVNQSAFKVENRQHEDKKKKTVYILRLGAFGPSNN